MSIMKKAAAMLSMVALIGSTMALPAFADGGQEVKTLAHWKFQDVAGYYTGSVDDDNITFVDLTGNGNDLVPVTAGNGDQLDIFMWDDGCDIPTAKGSTALKMDNTKVKAATVDPYTAEETSYTGGYTSGKYLETVESAPLNNTQFEHGFAFEIVYKLSPELDNNYNRYTGLFSRQGVVEGANEPPFSIALAEWNNEETTGTLGANGTWMQYVHVDPDGMKTNNEYDSAMMYAGDWHHILVTSDGELTEIYVDGEDIDLVGESSLIAITDPSYRWEVGVGRKDGAGHEGDSKNEMSPKGMIRRLFAGTISEIRVCDGYMSLEDSLWFKAASYDSIPTPVETAEAPAEAAPAEEAPAAATYPASGADGSIINGTVIGNETGWGDNAAAGAAAAFDGDAATFFDPLGVGDGFCGIDAGESYILDKVVILSRADWNARFVGAMIQGSNDGENWTTLWTSDVEGTNPDYYTVTEFENNTGYSQFRYFNETNHGDVAEVEFYGQPGKVEALPGFETADEAVASIGKTAIAGYTFKEGSGGNGGEGPENIWDGDTATKFCTGEFPISSTAELDGWYKVDGIVMATANDNAEYNGRLPSAWTVSGSADGENWTVIASGDESFFDEVNFRYFAGDASSDAVKFVKFDAEGASSGCFQISELVLTGAKTDAPAAPVDQTLDQKAEAPNTFDFGIIAAAAAVVSLGGFALTKKKH